MEKRDTGKLSEQDLKGLEIRVNELISTCEELKKDNYKIVDRVGVQAKETNFYSVLTKLKGLKPDVVGFSTYGSGVPAMFRQAKEVGFKTKWVTLQQPIYEHEAGPLAHGVIRALFFYATPENPKAMEFEKKIKAKYADLSPSEKKVADILKTLDQYGKDKVQRFQKWVETFEV